MLLLPQLLLSHEAWQPQSAKTNANVREIKIQSDLIYDIIQIH